MKGAPVIARRKQQPVLRILSKTGLARDILAFLVDGQARGLSPGTITSRRKELGYFQTYLERRAIHSVEDITANDIRQYMLTLTRRRKPISVDASYRVIRVWLRWIWQEYDIDKPCPVEKVRGPQLPAELLEPVSLDSLKAMLATCRRRTFLGDRDRAILLCLLDTGCRASEFLAWNVNDVNLATGGIIVRRGKGGKFRTVFLGAKARRELMCYLRHRGEAKPGEALWLAQRGNRLTYSGLKNMLHSRANAAGIPPPSVHSFRRAFALMSLRGGMDVYSLQRLMGHSDLTMLRRYLAQTREDLAEAHRKAGPVDHLL